MRSPSASAPPASPASPVGRVPLWAWPTVLALDAPLVAVVWLLWFARVGGVALEPAAPWVLGASVWLVYSADRLLDSLRPRAAPSPTRPPTLRHALARRVLRSPRRVPLLGGWLALLALDVALALGALEPATLTRGAALLLAAVGYLGIAHGPLRRHLPRGWLVGALFAGAMAVFLGAAALSPALLPALLLFAALCRLNVVLIGRWERHLDDGHPRDAFDPPGRPGGTALGMLAGAGLALGGAGALALPLAGAWLALAALQRRVRRVPGDGSGWEPAAARRALADAALLTPLPLWLAAALAGGG